MISGNNIYKTTINIVVVLGQEILPLTVDIKLGVDFIENEPIKQLIAFERIQFFLNAVFNGSVFINRHHKHIKKFHMFNTRIAECWDDPWDQFLALMLYAKLTAIMEGEAYLNMISVECHGGEGMEFIFEQEDLYIEPTDEDIEHARKLKPFELDTIWMYRSDLTTNDYIRKGNVIANLDEDWEDVGLGWKLPEHSEKPINNVKQFTPRIIK